VRIAFQVVVAAICTVSILGFGMVGYGYWQQHMRPPASARLDARLIGWGLLPFVAICAFVALIGVWGWAIGPR